MNKLCNVKPVRVIYGVGPRPFDTERRMVLSGKDIIVCMASGQVEEVLNNGTTRLLDQSNYLVDDELTIHDIDGFLNGKVEKPVVENVKPVVEDVDIHEDTVNDTLTEETIDTAEETIASEDIAKEESEEDKVPVKQPSKKNSKKK